MRICFPDEICPTYCDHGHPSADWDADLGHTPLTLNVHSGPYFYENSPALDFHQLVQVEQGLPSEIAEQNGRSAAFHGKLHVFTCNVYFRQ